MVAVDALLSVMDASDVNAVDQVSFFKKKFSF